LLSKLLKEKKRKGIMDEISLSKTSGHVQRQDLYVLWEHKRKESVKEAQEPQVPNYDGKKKYKNCHQPQSLKDNQDNESRP